MGGYGTYKFATQFPDLFAKAQPTVGPPGLGVWAPPADPQPGGAQSNTNRMLGSVRNIPFLTWYAAQDELVPVRARRRRRTPSTHSDTATSSTCSTRPSTSRSPSTTNTARLQTSSATEVDRNPAHVTYAYNPTMDFPGVQTAAGHAYWVSGVTLRNGSGTAPLGTIDVRSRGFGVGDPRPGAHTAGPARSAAAT